MFFLCHSVFLIFFVLAVAFAGLRVSKLGNPSDIYQERLFTFGYFSLSAWVLWLFQYAIVATPALPFARVFPLDFALWLGVAQNTFWAAAVLSLRFEKLSRKSLTLPVLLILSLLTGFVAYRTRILTSEKLNDFVAAVDVFVNAAIFVILAILIEQLSLSRASAVAFLIHGCTQWMWRWLWLTPLSTTVGVQLGFPLWRVLLVVAWIKVISEMAERRQPSLGTVDSHNSSDNKPSDLTNLLRPLSVMISSTIRDLGPERKAAARAIRELRFTPLLSETFGSTSHSPEAICALLAEQCDIYVLIIGARYGTEIESKGISIVEFEFGIALKKNRQKILVYVKTEVEREPRLEAFVAAQLQGFEKGYFWTEFTTPQQLHDQLRNDIVRWIAYQLKQDRS